MRDSASLTITADMAFDLPGTNVFLHFTRSMLKTTGHLHAGRQYDSVFHRLA